MDYLLAIKLDNYGMSIILFDNNKLSPSESGDD
jgi:hypothetical protein